MRHIKITTVFFLGAIFCFNTMATNYDVPSHPKCNREIKQLKQKNRDLSKKLKLYIKESEKTKQKRKQLLKGLNNLIRII